MPRPLRTTLALLLTLSVLGLVRGQDTVNFIDKVAKKDGTVKGKIVEETPGGVKVEVKAGKGTEVKVIPTAEIKSIVYQVPEGAIEFRAPFAKEERAADPKNAKNRATLLLEAQAGFGALAAKVARPEAKRYLQFKEAMVRVTRSQDDPALTAEAIKALTDYKTANPGGWQILPALKTLSKMLEEAGKLDEARKAYEELADLPDAPLELKNESVVLVSKLLIRGGKFADAQTRLEKLAGTLSREDVNFPFVKAHLVEAKMGQDAAGDARKDLQEAISLTPDARLRGLAHNLLGDYHRKKGELDAAFWNYLRVDAVYNEDVEEHSKALYHLSGMYERQKKDPQRGKECLRKLLDARYKGTAGQKLAVAEGKKVEE